MTSEQQPLLGSSSSTTPPQPNILTQEDNLSKFRIAIGINVDQTGLADLEAARKRPRGIYKEIISVQRKRYVQYQAVEVLYYGAIITQILIGAVLAALGSLSSLHPIAITVLGISNTFTAGVLALLKGQGLPDRLRKDQYQMKKVQDFIEETEIRLAVAGEGSVTAEQLDTIIEQIFDKYNSARDTAEMNRSSSYAHQVEGGTDGRQGLDGAGDGLKSTVRRIISDQNAAGKSGKAKYLID